MLTDDAHPMTHDDGRYLIALGHLSDSSGLTRNNPRRTERIRKSRTERERKRSICATFELAKSGKLAEVESHVWETHSERFGRM